jgi:hypothetical protein
MQILITFIQFSPVSCYILSLMLKYCLQQPVFEHNLCPSLGVRDHVPHAHKTTGKVIVLCILIIECLHCKRLEDSHKYPRVKYYFTYLVTPECIVYSRHVNC